MIDFLRRRPEAERIITGRDPEERTSFMLPTRRVRRKGETSFRVPLSPVERAAQLELNRPPAVARVLNQPPVPVPERSAGEVIGDTAGAFGAAALRNATALTDLFGANNPTSVALRGWSDDIDATASPGRRAELELQAREAQALGPQASFLDKFGLKAKQVIRNPAASIAEGGGGIVPLALAGAAGALAGAPAATVALGTGVLSGLGAVKGQIFETVQQADDADLMQDPEYAQMRAGGATEVDAKQALATKMQSYLENPAKIGLGGVVGGLAGRFGADRAIAGLAGGGRNMVREILTRDALGATAKGIGKGAISEAITEGPQEGIEQFLGNTGAAAGGARIDPMAGVPESIAAASLMSLVPGGAATGFSGLNARRGLARMDAEEAAAAGLDAERAARAPQMDPRVREIEAEGLAGPGALGRISDRIANMAPGETPEGIIATEFGLSPERAAKLVEVAGKIPGFGTRAPGRALPSPGLDPEAAGRFDEAIAREDEANTAIRSFEIDDRPDAEGYSRLFDEAIARQEPSAVERLLRQGLPSQRNAAAETSAAEAEAKRIADERAAFDAAKAAERFANEQPAPAVAPSLEEQPRPGSVVLPNAATPAGPVVLEQTVSQDPKFPALREKYLEAVRAGKSGLAALVDEERLRPGQARKVEEAIAADLVPDASEDAAPAKTRIAAELQGTAPTTTAEQRQKAAAGVQRAETALAVAQDNLRYAKKQRSGVGNAQASVKAAQDKVAAARARAKEIDDFERMPKADVDWADVVVRAQVAEGATRVLPDDDVLKVFGANATTQARKEAGLEGSGKTRLRSGGKRAFEEGADRVADEMGLPPAKSYAEQRENDRIVAEAVEAGRTGARTVLTPKAIEAGAAGIDYRGQAASIGFDLDKFVRLHNKAKVGDLTPEQMRQYRTMVEAAKKMDIGRGPGESYTFEDHVGTKAKAEESANQNRRNEPDLREPVGKFIEENPNATREEIAAEAKRLRTELNTDVLTGLGSERALIEDEKTNNPPMAIVDANGLGWWNKFSQIYGDRLLKGIANAMRFAMAEYPGTKGYRHGGDEFAITGASEDVVSRVAARMNELMEPGIFTVEEPDGTLRRFTGVTIDYGVGTQRAAAAGELAAARKELAAAGLRAKKGEQPAGVVEVDSEGKQVGVDNVPGSSRDERAAGDERPADPAEQAQGVEPEDFLKPQQAPKDFGKPPRKQFNQDKSGQGILPGDVAFSGAAVETKVTPDKTKAEEARDAERAEAEKKADEAKQASLVDAAAAETEKAQSGAEVQAAKAPVGVSVAKDDPRRLEPSLDRSLSASHLFGNANDAEAIRVQGFHSLDRKRQGVVLGHVIAAINQEKVFRAVVQAVPVDVMNGLVGAEGTAEDLLHNKAVLAHRLSVPSDKAVLMAVSRFVDAVAAASGVRATAATEDAPLGSSSRPIDLLRHGLPTSTTRATDVDHSSIVPATDASPGQKDAGNYQKQHAVWNGLEISIENAAGSRRRPEWPVLKSAYGYLKGTTGKDKENLDVFIKTGQPLAADGPVYVINQYVNGRFDEHKIMLGWTDDKEAQAAYLENYTKGWKGLKSRGVFPTVEAFKEWLKDGDHTKPAPVRKADPAAAARGARVASPEGAAKVEAAQEAARAAIRKEYPTPRERADAVEAALDEVKQAQADAHTAAGKPVARAATPQATAKPATKADPRAAVADAGEKIGGSRKDRWAARGLALGDLEGMSGGEQSQLVTKENVWPKIDYAARIKDGMDPNAAALLKGLRDGIAAKPKKDTAQARAAYVEVLGHVRDLAAKAKTFSDVQAINDGVQKMLGIRAVNRAEAGAMSDADRTDQRARYDKLYAIYKGRTNPLQAKDYDSVRRAGKLLRTGWPNAEKAATTTEAKDGKKALPARPHLDAIERTGEDVRNGRDVTSEELQKHFGFRGVEFGNWAANDERQKLVNLAFEALHDLANVMGIPPKAISLNGTLGLGLASRGSGKAAAHYEPGKLVINMTKINGAGSLAHEWGHALDHYFGELNRPDAYQGGARGASGWYRKGTAKLENLRAEVKAAFERVMQTLFNKMQTKAEVVRGYELDIEKVQAKRDDIAKMATTDKVSEQTKANSLEFYDRQITRLRDSIKEARATMSDDAKADRGVRSDYVSEALKLSGPTGEYWQRPTEMFARAFESFVFDRIRADDRVSDYLVHGVEADRYAKSAYKGNPYPTGVERSDINAALQNLVDAIQSRETEKGVALYSAKPKPAPFYSPLERAASALKQPMKGADALRFLSTREGVKAAEIKWTGLDDFLRRKGEARVTPAEIQEYLKANAVTVKEVTLQDRGRHRQPDEPGIRPVRDALRKLGYEIGLDRTDPDAQDPFLVTDLKTGDVVPGLAFLQTGAYPEEAQRLATQMFDFVDSEVPGGAKFGGPKTTLPGGKNYKEVLLTLPARRMSPDAAAELYYRTFVQRGGESPWSELTPNRRAEAIKGMPPEAMVAPASFSSTHFDEPNILAHVRFNERTDANGKRVLFLEEIQSDWAQSKRKQKPPLRVADVRQVAGDRFPWKAFDQNGELLYEGLEEADVRMRAEMAANGRSDREIPSAPFVEKTEDWTALALKSVLHYAAANGFDSVAWTPGSVQAARYDLSKQVSKIQYDADGVLAAWDQNGNNAITRKVAEKDLPEVIGKEAAERLVSAPKSAAGRRTLEGNGLKVGGSGMVAFYDRIVPQVAEKIGKKFGTKVGTVRVAFGKKLSSDGGDQYIDQDHRILSAAQATKEVQSIPITPEMRAGASEGFPLFKTDDGTPSTPPVDIAAVRREFPRAEVRELGPGTFEVKDGLRTIHVRVDDEGLAGTVDRGAFRAAYGRDFDPANDAVVGAWVQVPRGGVMWLAKTADSSVLRHERFHYEKGKAPGTESFPARIARAFGFGSRIALTDEERAALYKKFEPQAKMDQERRSAGSWDRLSATEREKVVEEYQAEAYAHWRPEEKANSLFSKILETARRFWRAFRPSWESAFERVSRGETSEGTGGRDAGTRFNAEPARIPPGDPRRDENFKKWFAGSKVVDAAGKPLVVYHGTPAEFTAFNSPAYFTDSNSEAYLFGEEVDPDSDIRVMPVYLSIKNPVVIESFVDFQQWDERDVSKFEAQGYDGAVHQDSRGKMFIAFDPGQVKSADGKNPNRGTFDPKNPDIRYSVAARNDSPATGATNVDAPKPARKWDPGMGRPLRTVPMDADELTRRVIEASNGTGTPAGTPIEQLAPPDFHRNFRVVLKSGVPKDEAEAFARIYAAFDKENDVARGKLSWEQGDKEALKLLGVHTREQFMDALKRGVVFNEPGLRAATRIMHEVREEHESAMATLNAAREAGGGKIDSDEYRAVAATSANLAAWTLALRGEQAEAARAFNARKDLRAGRTDSEKLLGRIFKNIGGLTDKQAEAILRTAELEPEKLPDAIRRAMKPGFWDYVNEWRKGGLLWSPRTFLGVNPFGNALKQAITLLEIPVGAAIDRARGGADSERQVRAGELAAAMAGLADYGPAALKQLRADVWNAMKGVEEFDVNKSRPFEHQVGVIPGPLGKLIRTPFRFLQAADDFFKETAKAQSLYREAFRRARNEGLTGQNATRRAEELIGIGKGSDWQDKRVAGMIDKANRMAMYETFTLPTNYENAGIFGSLASAVQQVERRRGISGAVGLFAPFKSTPAHIAYQSFERSPFGLFLVYNRIKELDSLRKSLDTAKGMQKEDILKDIEAKTQEMVEQMARAVIGSALFGVAASMAALGLLTGSGPADWEDRKVWMDAGNIPTGVKVGDSDWYAYDRFEPAAASIAIAANFPDILKERSFGGQAAAFMNAMQDAWVSKTYLQGLEQFGDVITDPKRYGEKWLRDLVGSFVPAAVAQTAEVLDPTVREKTGSLLDGFRSRVPGLSDDLPASRTGTGEPAKRTGRLGGGSPLNPLGFIRTGSADGDPLAKEFLDADYSPTPPRKTIVIGVGPKGYKRRHEVALLPAELEAFRKADERVTRRLRRLIETDRWQDLDPYVKKQTLQRVYDAAANAVRELVLPRAARRLKQQLSGRSV